MKKGGTNLASRKAKTRTIGCRVDEQLWKDIRKLAIDLDKKATNVLDEAMRDYLKKHSARVK